MKKREAGIAEENLVLEAFPRFFWIGRSSRFGFERHSILRQARYQALLAAPATSTSGHDEAAGMARSGRLLRLLGLRAQSRERLEDALARAPFLPSAHAYRWELRLGPGHRRVSFSDIDRAVVLAPGSALWRAWRGFGHLLSSAQGERGAARKAARDAEAALEKDSTLVLGHLIRAACLEQEGAGRRARASLDQALRLEPRQAWLYRWRSRQRFLAGDKEGFLADAERALLLEEGVNSLAEVLGYLGDLGRRRLASSSRRGQHSPRLSPRETLGFAGAWSYRRLAQAAEFHLRRHPRDYWTYVVRGDCRRSPEINDHSGAMRDLETAVSLRPDCSWAWAYLSRARAARGDAAGALEASGEAVRLEPECGWFHAWRGQMLCQMSDLSGGIHELDRGLELDPDYEMAYAWRGSLRRRQGRREEALADLEIAVRLIPGHAWTLFERSLALRGAGRIEEALESLEAAYRLNPKYSWWDKPGDATRALAAMGASPRGRPASARRYAWRARVKISLGDFRGAGRDLRRALLRDPSSAWARFWRGCLAARLGRLRPALKEFSSALRSDPGLAAAWAWRGRLRHLGGAPRGALEDLRRASRLDRESVQILTWKGQLEVDLRLWRRALADLNRALQLHPANQEALRIRAAARQALGEEAAALQDRRAAEALGGGTPP